MVSVIIVNYGGQRLILDCLKSLERQVFTDFEVIIVDNEYSDASLDHINGFLRQSSLTSVTKVVSLPENYGFSGGNLKGLSFATGEYIALLNNDTEAEKYCLEELERAMRQNPSVGICATKLVNHGMDKIDSAGDIFTTLLKGDKRGEGRGVDEFNREEYAFGACAGAALYRRVMLQQIGFLDDDFFLIHEDTDLNFRAQLSGWKVLYVPTAIVHHKVRSSIGNMSDKAVYYSLRNSELVRIKNVPFGVFLRCFPEFILGVISEFLYFAIKRRRFKLFMAAKKDALKMLPRMWQKRKMIMKTKKVTDRYLLSIMTPIWKKDFFKTKLNKFLHG